MPQVRDYPQALTLLPTDAFIIDRLGIGTMYIEAQNAFEGSYDIAMNYPATPPSGTVFIEFVAVRPFVIPSVTNPSPPPAPTPLPSQFYAFIPPSAPTVLTVAKNGVGVGSVTFAGGSNVGTYTWPFDVAFVAGDVLQVLTPSNINGLGGIALTFAGYRQ